MSRDPILWRAEGDDGEQMAASAADVNAYMSALPDSSRPFAETLRRTIQAALPGSTETIRYGIPAYRIGKWTIIHFAVWKAHAALYPIYRGDESFERLVAPFRDKKDTLRLSLQEPLPFELVTIVARAQLKRSTGP